MALWTPAEITTALWLDAADASTIEVISGGVSNWADKSGNGKDATQGTAALRPAYDSVNKKLDFDLDLMMLPTNLASLNSVSLFFVGRYTSVADITVSYLIFANGAGADQRFYCGQTVDTTQFVWAVEISTGFVHPPDGDTASHIFGLTHGNNTATAYLDGTKGTAATKTSTASITNWVLGGINSTVSRLRGSIEEVVLVKNLLHDSDLQKVEGYLAWKWNLVANLPAAHPYKAHLPSAVDPYRFTHHPRLHKVIPTLTSPTVTDIGATCVRPRVTKGY